MAANVEDVELDIPEENEVRINSPILKENEAEATSEQGLMAKFGVILIDAIFVIPLIVGAVSFDDCPGVYSLTSYLVTLGAIGITHSLIKLMFKTRNDPNGFATKVASLFTLALIVCTIWGAVLTFQRVSDYNSDAMECSSHAFWCAFVFALLPFIGVFLTCFATCCRMRSQAKKQQQGQCCSKPPVERTASQLANALLGIEEVQKPKVQRRRGG